MQCQYDNNKQNYLNMKALVTNYRNQIEATLFVALLAALTYGSYLLFPLVVWNN